MKRGATIVNFVLIFGLVVIAFVGIVSLQKMNAFQYKMTEYSRLEKFAKDIKANIEQAESLPSDFSYNITVPFVIEYVLTIDEGLVSLYFPKEGVNITEPFATTDLNIIPTRVINSGKISINKKDANLLISGEAICNLSDRICDFGCVIEGVCDSECYSAYINDICNPFCLDYDKNGVVDKSDADGVCDADCYNNIRNGGYYDIDCMESGDSMCDPDSDNVFDGICDSDCIIKNGICDPDCGKIDLDCSEDVLSSRGVKR